jgi:hypothetical protein
MNYYDAFIYFIIFIKIAFIIMTITHLYLKFYKVVKGDNYSELDKKIVFWKERFEFIFVALMALLLIFLFSPRNNRIVLIDKETKVLFYLFGFILLITANWNLFIHESYAFKTFTNIIGN